MKKDRFRLLIDGSGSSEQSDSFGEGAVYESRQRGSNMGM